MKKCFSILLGLCFVLSVQAQDDVRNIGSYKTLDVSGSVSIELVKQSNPTAAITMEKGDIKNLITEKNGNTLKIELKKGATGSWSSGEKAKIVLGFNDLSKIDCNAGAAVRGTDKISANEVIVKASSGSAVSVCVDASKTIASASSGAALTLEGSSENFQVNASSGAAISAHKLTAENVTADASSGAALKVHAREKINAKSSSGAAIQYTGEPKEKNIDAGKWSGGSIGKF